MATKTKKFAFGRKDENICTRYKSYVDKYEEHVNKEKQVTRQLEKINLESLVYQSSDFNNVSEKIVPAYRKLASDMDQQKMSQDYASKCEAHTIISQSFSNKIKSCQTQSMISEDIDLIRTWNLQLHPSDIFPDVELKVQFQTISDPKDPKSKEAPSVHDVKIQLTGVDVPSEIETAIQDCQEDNEIQLFMMILDDYLVFCKQRTDLIEKALKSENVSARNGKFLEFRDNDGRALVYLRLDLEYCKQSLGWTGSWKCKFTELGLTAAQSVNFPEQLLQHGFCEDWDMDSCLENLTKLSVLSNSCEESTPAFPQPRHFSTPLVVTNQQQQLQPAGHTTPAAVNEDDTFAANMKTPLNSQQTQRPPKRRLN